MEFLFLSIEISKFLMSYHDIGEPRQKKSGKNSSKQVQMNCKVIFELRSTGTTEAIIRDTIYSELNPLNHRSILVTEKIVNLGRFNCPFKPKRNVNIGGTFTHKLDDTFETKTRLNSYDKR